MRRMNGASVGLLAMLLVAGVHAQVNTPSYTYRGCFSNTPTDTLAFKGANNNARTCFERCQSMDYDYFALQGASCFCGKGRISGAPSNLCNSYCLTPSSPLMSSAELCGSEKSIEVKSVYAITRYSKTCKCPKAEICGNFTSDELNSAYNNYLASQEKLLALVPQLEKANTAVTEKTQAVSALSADVQSAQANVTRTKSQLDQKTSTVNSLQVQKTAQEQAVATATQTVQSAQNAYNAALQKYNDALKAYNDRKAQADASQKSCKDAEDQAATACNCLQVCTPRICIPLVGCTGGSCACTNPIYYLCDSLRSVVSSVCQLFQEQVKDLDLYKAILDAAKTGLDTAQSGLNNANAGLDAAKTSLANTNKALTAAIADQQAANAAYLDAQATLKTKQNELAKAQADLATAKITQSDLLNSKASLLAMQDDAKSTINRLDPSLDLAELLNFELFVSDDLRKNIEQLTAKGLSATKFTSQLENLAREYDSLAAFSTEETLCKDHVPPVLTLKPPLIMTIEGASPYEEPGYMATDNEDGDVSRLVVVDGIPNTMVVGTYNISYTITDSSGNVVSATRLVRVVDTIPPTVQIANTIIEISIHNKNWTDPGFSAIDKVDGDVSKDRSLVNITNLDSLYTALQTGVVPAEFVPPSSEDNTLALQALADLKVQLNSTQSARDAAADQLALLIQTIANAQDAVSNAQSTFVQAQADVRSALVATNAARLLCEEALAKMDRYCNCDSFAGVCMNPLYTNCENQTLIDDQKAKCNASDTANANLVQLQTAEAYARATNLNVAAALLEAQKQRAQARANLDVLNAKVAELSAMISVAEVKINNPRKVAGIFQITYNVRDRSNNAASASRIVRVISQGPVLTLKGDPFVTRARVGRDSEGMKPYFNDPGATAFDDATDISASIQVVSNVDLTEPGSYSITYSVKNRPDAGQIVRFVVVKDMEKPTITLLGAAQVTLEAGAEYVDAGVSVMDNYDRPQDLLQRLVVTNQVETLALSGTQFTVTYDLFDAAGNQATSVSRTVTIKDTVAPVLTVFYEEDEPSPYVIQAGLSFDDLGASAFDMPYGWSKISVNNPVQIKPRTVPADYTVTYTASDIQGNIAQQTRVVRVVDTWGPVITVNGARSLLVEAGSTWDNNDVSAFDIRDGPVPVTADVVPNTRPDVIPTSYIVTYSAVDQAGNAAQPVSINVTIVDTSRPSLLIVGNANVTLEAGSVWSEPGYSAQDAFDGVLTDKVVVSMFQVKDGVEVPVDSINSRAGEGALFVIRYSVSDRARNVATAVRRVRVRDTLPPVIALMMAPEINYQASKPPKPFTFDTLGLSVQDQSEGNLLDAVTLSITKNAPSNPSRRRRDNVSGVEQIKEELKKIDASAPLGTVYVLTFTVSDSVGNKATAVRNVKLVDNEPPTLVLQIYKKQKKSNDIYIEVGTPYEEPGAFAEDGYDGDVTGSIIVLGDIVNTTVAGQNFTIKYIAYDSSRNSAIQYRTVRVLSKAAYEAAVAADSKADNSASGGGATSGSSNSKLAIIVGAAVGGVALVLFLIFIAVRGRKSRDATLYIKDMADVTGFSNPLYAPIPLDLPSYFHGKIPREEAETRVCNMGLADGQFLVYQPGEVHNELVIALAQNGRVRHASLTRSSNGNFQIDRATNFTESFASTLEDLISFLSSDSSVLGTALTETVPAPTYQDLVVYQASHENPYMEVQTALGGSEGLQLNPVLSVEGSPHRRDLNKVKCFYMPVLRNHEAIHPNAPLYGLAVLPSGNNVFVALDRYHLPVDIPVFTCIDNLGKIMQYELGASDDKSLINKVCQVRKFNGVGAVVRVDPRVEVPRSVVLQNAQDSVGLYDDVGVKKQERGVVVNAAYASRNSSEPLYDDISRSGGSAHYDVAQYENPNSNYLLVGGVPRSDFEEEGEYMDVSRPNVRFTGNDANDNYMVVGGKNIDMGEEGDYDL